jgi:predicted DNA-binding transcriptional regulator YafY
VSESVWKAVETALLGGRRLEIGYRGLKDRCARKRTVEPQALFMKGTGWYLVAWTACSREPRLFRLDRMETAAAMEERIAPRSDFDLASFVDETPGVWHGDGRPLDAQVEILPSHVAAVRSEALARGLGFHPKGEGAVLEIARGHVDEVAWWLAPFGEGLRVLRPQGLRSRMAELGRRIIELNEG